MFIYWKLAATALAGSILLAAPTGYQHAVVNAPYKILKDFVAGSLYQLHGYRLSEGTLAIFWAGVVASHDFGQLFGALFSVYVLHIYGRKNTLFVGCNILYATGSALMALAYPTNSFHVLICGRFLFGIGSGLVYVALPIYLIECAPLQSRGFFGSMLVMGYGIGAVAALGLGTVLNTPTLWPYLFIASCIVAVPSIALAAIFHESPSYLVVVKENMVSTYDALLFFYGPQADIQSHLLRIRREETYVVLRWQDAYRQLFRFVAYRKLFWICTGLFLTQSAVVLTCLLSYSTILLVDFGFPYASAQFLSLGLSAVYCLTAIMAPCVVHLLRRRSVMLISIGLVSSATALYLILSVSDCSVVCRVIAYVLTCLITAGWTVGPATVPRFVYCEFVPLTMRTVFGSLCGALQLLILAGEQLAFYPLYQCIGSLIFIPFVFTSLAALIFVYYGMPETKDRLMASVASQYAAVDDDNLLGLPGPFSPCLPWRTRRRYGGMNTEVVSTPSLHGPESEGEPFTAEAEE